MNKISFSPNSITKKLLSSLDTRPKKVLEERFGLVSLEPRTLESIGQEYGITRERVRQIEAFAINKIKNSEAFKQISDVFNGLQEGIDSKGGLVQEDDFLSFLSKKRQDQRHFFFLLVVGEPFTRLKEDEHFHHSWAVDTNYASGIRDALKKVHNEITDDRLFTEKEVISVFEKHLDDVIERKLEQEVLLSLLKVSRVISKNPLGEWGVASSSFIKPRGMRDYAFLVMRKHGSPMHFTEVAKAIQKIFSRMAHTQTVHNELIKDGRFVLVGRGLYALKEWGYENGIVRDVICNILKDDNPMRRDDIVKRVLKERYVKENTILVNLQNTNYFKKDSEGKYTLI